MKAAMFAFAVYAVSKAARGGKNREDEDDAGTLSPCYPGRITRWVFNEATCENATALSAQTRAAIEFMLSNSGDENPYMKDVTFPEADSGYSCASNEDRLLNIEIQIGSLCYAHVHPHLMNVYDVTECE